MHRNGGLEKGSECGRRRHRDSNQLGNRVVVLSFAPPSMRHRGTFGTQNSAIIPQLVE